MAKYTGSVCRLCRREGMKLFLKGERCYTGKCAISKERATPGQHGQSRKKLSEYGMQLREKQKARRFYGVLEAQFAHYFELAEHQQGQAGENLLRLLESRLDNVAYRLGFAMSRPEARQFVTHGHFTVNGKNVNIPSYLVKPGDVIAFRTKSLESNKVKSVLEANSARPIPGWLSLNPDTKIGTVVNLPSREDIDIQIEEHLIVELYSK